jgi:hypothetical protein
MRTGREGDNKVSRRTVRVTLVMALVSSWCFSTVAARERPTGSVCVARVPDATPGERSLANPTGGGRSWEFTVQVDDGQVHATSPQRAVAIEGLALGTSHLFRIRDKGKVVTSFRFTFEKQGATDLCLWWKALYETWSLWPLRDATHLCACGAKGDQAA